MKSWQLTMDKKGFALMSSDHHSKKSLFGGRRRKHDWVSERKSLQEDMESLGFTSYLAKPKIGKKDGRRDSFIR